MPDLEESIHLESKTAEPHFNISSKTDRGKKKKKVNPSFIGLKKLNILRINYTKQQTSNFLDPH